MGNSTNLPPSRITSISFKQSSSDPSSNYTIEEYRNFNHASPDQKYFLISKIYPCFFSLFSSSQDFSELIQNYFYSPFASSSTLFTIRAKSSTEILGFNIITYIEISLLPNDLRNENKYITINGFGCLKQIARGEGFQKRFNVYKNKSEIFHFKDKNILLVDVCINPLSYYGVCQISKVLYPKFDKKTPAAFRDIFKKVRKIAEYEGLDENNEFLVKDYFIANENLLERFRGNQGRFPKDIRFFNEVTGLRESVALGYVAVVNLVTGNTLGLPAGDYTVGENEFLDFAIVDFDRPRI